MLQKLSNTTLRAEWKWTFIVARLIKVKKQLRCHVYSQFYKCSLSNYSVAWPFVGGMKHYETGEPKTHKAGR